MNAKDIILARKLGGGGGELPKLTNPAAASDVLSGKEYINGAGAKKTGGLELQNPSINVDSTGLITAEANGKNGTHKLSAADDPNFVPENIKKDVTLFGLLGTHEGGGGIQNGIEVLEMKTYTYSGSSMYRVPKKAKLHASEEIWWLALANRNTNTDYAEWYQLEEFEIVVHSPVKYIEVGAFTRLSALKDISMLKSIEWIAPDVFEHCTGLVGDVEFPNLEEINNYTKSHGMTYINRGGGLFPYCTGITSVSVPKLKGIYRDFCIGCTSLKTVYAPLCQYLGTQNNNRGAFFGCTALESVQLGSVGCECNVIDIYSSFQGCTQSTLTITLYCTQANANSYLAKLRNGATNATIIIKDSVTGDTIVTSTP